MGRSLHDDVGPALAAIRVSVEACRRKPDSLQLCLTTIDHSAAALESWVLRQRAAMLAALVQRAGLEDALHWYAAHLERERGLGLAVRYEGCEVPLEPALAVLAFVDAVISGSSPDQAHTQEVQVLADERELKLTLTVRGSAPTHNVPNATARLLHSLGGTIRMHESFESYEALLLVPLPIP